MWSQRPQVHHHIVGFQIAIAAYVEISNAGLDMSFAKSAGWSLLADVFGCWLKRISNVVKTHSISWTVFPYLKNTRTYVRIYKTIYVSLILFQHKNHRWQGPLSKSDVFCRETDFQYMFGTEVGTVPDRSRESQNTIGIWNWIPCEGTALHQFNCCRNCVLGHLFRHLYFTLDIKKDNIYI